MSKELSPQRWAFDLSHLLKTVFKADRFPVDVRALAPEYTSHRFPDDPVTDVRGADLPGFEGALFRAAAGKKGWGIVYNNAIRSKGRINFTLAHEFGHYLLHRLKYPDGISCGEKDMAAWDSEYKQVEGQANEFAATLLMPLDDFREQIRVCEKPTLDMLGSCAARYDVSLTAAILRWLQYTTRRSILVVSRDGFILWARSSEPALRTGAFFRTYNVSPVPIPVTSLAAQRQLVEGGKDSATHNAGVWLKEPCSEEVLFSDQYDYTISLLHLGDAPSRFERRDDLDEEPVEDMHDQIARHSARSSLVD